MAFIFNFKNNKENTKETGMVFLPGVEDAINGVGNAHIIVKNNAVVIRVEGKKTHEWVRNFSTEEEKNKYIKEGEIVLKDFGFTLKK